ncbi:DMT family transporter [Bacillus sp. B190/17]|uniref:DMT family transporter n=1 Tax=Bacillus lumedeiriae TaxID=3058829 RepID=A0ABW8I9Z0_9BACI
MRQNKFLTGILMCLIAVICWGGMYPVMGNALQIMDPFYFTLFRFGIAMVILVLLLILIEGKGKFSTEGKTIKLWFLGTMGFTGFGFLVFLGQKLAGPSGTVIAAVIMAVQPLLGVIVNWVTKKGSPKPFTVLLMLTGLIGVVIVISNGDLSIFVSEDGDTFAYLIILIGALCFVIYTMGGDYFPEWSPLRYSTITTIFGTVSNVILVGLATCIGWLNVPTLSMIDDVSGSLLYMSLIAGVLGIFVWNIGNRIITPINGILFINMVPVTTFIIYVIQGYHLTAFELIGTLITIASLIGNNLYIRKLNKQISPQSKVKTV